MNIIIDPALTGKALIDHLVTNKKQFIAQKKAQRKEADGFAWNNMLFLGKEATPTKATPKATGGLDVDIVVVPIINTTFWHDSHDDVHIDGLWDKTLKENHFMMHLQEHKMAFDKIISDGEDLTVYTQKIAWTHLGVNAPGTTEALMFNSIVKRSRNEYMHDQYRKGFVRNHSVSMQYVNIELAINDEDYKEELAVWNKYIDRIANKEHSLSQGYFWAVKEAKAIEGSAVPIGSNTITPTYSVSEKQDTVSEPDNSTQDQPSEPIAFDISQALKTTIFII